MNFAAVFVRRPVLATMVIVLLVVLGLFSYRTLGVDLFPNVDLPVVTITTTLKGASPEEMEAQITKIIEEAVNTASGIDELRSTTLEGISIVTVTFMLERNTAEAVQDVRDKVARIVGLLPEGTDAPVIARFDTDAIPVATIVVSGPQQLKELTEYADKSVKEDLEAINGVGQAVLVGGQRRAINVWLDAAKLSSHHLSVQQIKVALLAQNVEVPTGRVESSSSERVLRTMGRVATVEDFEQLIVDVVDGQPITIGELGHAEDGIEEARSLSRYDGKNAIAIVVQKQSGTNSVQVVDRIKERLEEIRPKLAPGINVEVVRDVSGFIKRSVEEVKLHLVLGAILASIVVLLFMGNVRSTLIAAIAIPSSLISTLTVMKAFGFTLNNLTLLGMTLAVGIVIDDAIVVLENIYRHIDELKKPPLQAAMDGTREIMLAVVATTSSLVVIFLPIAFMAGRVGRFFHSFGITVAVAIGFSLLIAVVLTPMLCSRFLRAREGGHEEGTRLTRWLHEHYGRLVELSMRHKGAVVIIAVLCVACIVPLFKHLGKDFIPLDDRGEFSIVVQTRPGTTLAGSDALMRELEGRVAKLPHVRHLLTTIGDTGNGNQDVTQCNLYVGLDPLDERGDKTTQFEVMTQARRILLDYPDLRAAVQPINDIQQGGAANFQFNYAIQGPDLGVLDQLAAKLMAQMRTVPGFVDIDTASAQRKPELQVHIDRRKAADLGVRAIDVATTLRTLVAGEPVTKFREGAEQYDVWLRVRPEDRASEASVYRLEVPTSNGGLTQLASLVALKNDTGPAQIDRINRQRQITLVGNLDGLPLGSAVEKVNEFVATADFPPGYAPMALGRAKVLAETGVNFAIAFLLSLTFMYIILAAQFESFLHPITIMLSLPLSIPFALASLAALGETLNLYSIIGVFMLFGIIKKNGILQVDYTNTLRAEGMARDEAILKANIVRLRPILMTTVTLIAGMIPIALGKGPGASSRASMAKVIIGGQALSLVITLLIVPVAYALFDDASAFFKGRLPEGVRAKKAWSYGIGGGMALMGTWLLMKLVGILAPLSELLMRLVSLTFLIGLVIFCVGIVLYQLDKRKGMRSIA